MRPLVSIVTPTYNRSDYLDETIKSVLTQDYPRIEYIVLDDGSTDSTRDILSNYSNRIIWETHYNMGEQLTVNKGWHMASGELIMTVNSDDPLLPGAIGTAVEFMAQYPDILVGYPDWDTIGPKSEFISHRQVPEYDYMLMLRKLFCVVGPGAIVRRKALDLVEMRDPEFKYVADFDFWLRLGLCGPFARIPKTLATWRSHSDAATLSANKQVLADEHIRMIRKLYSRPDLPAEVLEKRDEVFAWLYYIVGTNFAPDKAIARKYFVEAFHHCPSKLLREANFHNLRPIFSSFLPKPFLDLCRRLWRVGG